jgi:hypothetical protein
MRVERASEGVPPIVIQRQLGHSNLGIGQRLASALIDSRSFRAAHRATENSGLADLSGTSTQKGTTFPIDASADTVWEVLSDFERYP